MNKNNLILSFLFLLLSYFGNAQGLKIKKTNSGIFGLGARSTTSLFNDSQTNNFGTGVGGQFRLQVSDRVNTDWFADYLTGNIGTIANRNDIHIGWSVMYYPWLKEKQIVKPYFLAGHCFDYSRLRENANFANSAQRWSSAVQAGIGTHFNLNERMDLSLTGQYMIHLGNHIDPEINGNTLDFNYEKGVSLEGHLLITVSLNFKIVDLW